MAVHLRAGFSCAGAIQWRFPYVSVSVGSKRATMQTRLPMEIVDRDMARFLAEKTEVQRLEIGWGMQRSAVRMMRRVIRAEHPDWTEEEVSREVAARVSHGG